MNESRRSIALASEEEMLAFGRRLGVAAARHPGLVVYLAGGLGAGKTTLARGWLAGMGHGGRVKSPTYTLLEPYSLPGGGELAHLDLYRIADPEELEFLGLRELADADHWLLIEWPEKGRGHLPAPDLQVEIDISGPGRVIHLTAANTAATRWLKNTLPPDTSR